MGASDAPRRRRRVRAIIRALGGTEVVHGWKIPVEFSGVRRRATCGFWALSVDNVAAPRGTSSWEDVTCGRCLSIIGLGTLHG